MTWGGGLQEPPPWKVFKMLIFDVVMNPTMSRNIFGVIWKFWKNSIFWVILESLLQLKRILDHFKSWNYPFLCVWWVTKSFELIKVPEVCFPGGALSAPPHVKCTKKYLMSNRVKYYYYFYLISICSNRGQLFIIQFLILGSFFCTMFHYIYEGQYITAMDEYETFW